MKKYGRISTAMRNRLRAHGVKRIDSSVTLRKVYEKYHGLCQGCECQTVYGVHPQIPKSATIEHIVPISQGGDHTWENVQLLCHACNLKRNEEYQLAKSKLKERSFRFLGMEIAVRWGAA